MQNSRVLENDGGIMVPQQDTAFGIGCRIDKATAIRKPLK